MRAVELYRRHSPDELVRMAEEIRRNPANRQHGGLYHFTPAARRKLNEIRWAIYFHLQDRGRP